jgi:hypothetical protein
MCDKDQDDDSAWTQENDKWANVKWIPTRAARLLGALGEQEQTLRQPVVSVQFVVLNAEGQRVDGSQHQTEQQAQDSMSSDHFKWIDYANHGYSIKRIETLSFKTPYDGPRYE